MNDNDAVGLNWSNNEGGLKKGRRRTPHAVTAQICFGQLERMIV